MSLAFLATGQWPRLTSLTSAHPARSLGGGSPGLGHVCRPLSRPVGLVTTRAGRARPASGFQGSQVLGVGSSVVPNADSANEPPPQTRTSGGRGGQRGHTSRMAASYGRCRGDGDGHTVSPPLHVAQKGLPVGGRPSPTAEKPPGQRGHGSGGVPCPPWPGLRPVHSHLLLPLDLLTPLPRSL